MGLDEKEAEGVVTRGSGFICVVPPPAPPPAPPPGGEHAVWSLAGLMRAGAGLFCIKSGRASGVREVTREPALFPRGVGGSGGGTRPASPGFPRGLKTIGLKRFVSIHPLQGSLYF